MRDNPEKHAFNAVMMRLHSSPDGWLLEQSGLCAVLPDFSLDTWLSSPDPVSAMQRRSRSLQFTTPLPEFLLAPCTHEIWRAVAPDPAWPALRPDLLFKATARRCVGSGANLKLRDDSRHTVPEPALALVISSGRRIAGFTIATDLVCRDIEEEGPLYRPQARTWDRCCAVGPCILLNDGSCDIPPCTLRLEVRRQGDVAYGCECSLTCTTGPFEELTTWLFRNQSFPTGVILLIAGGATTPEAFALQPHDQIAITLPEIGTLSNRVE